MKLTIVSNKYCQEIVDSLSNVLPRPKRPYQFPGRHLSHPQTIINFNIDRDGNPLPAATSGAGPSQG